MNDRRTRRLIWIIVGVAVFFLAAAVVQWLWNSTIPWVIGFPPVTYWQAAGLLLLSRMFFGGLGRMFGPERSCSCRELTSRETETGAGNVERTNAEQKSEYLLRNRAFLNEVDDR